MLCNNVPVSAQQFEHSALSPEFPGGMSSLNLLEAPFRFREYLTFFLWFLKDRVLDKFIQFKNRVKSSSH